MSAELPVIADCYALTLELSRRVEKFPRHHRATLGAELTGRSRDLLAGLIRARYAAPADRPPLLAAANVELELLRFGLRLAADLRALPLGGHGHLIRLAAAVGAQVGGWLKASRGDG
ncbi:MAG: four helix bundle protein [Gemmataceae bacterium]|nr:four helix bundle protein [Gemmataceae bacterium]